MIFWSGKERGRVVVRVLGIWHVPEFAGGNVPSMELSPMTYVWWKQTEKYVPFDMCLKARP